MLIVGHLESGPYRAGFIETMMQMYGAAGARALGDSVDAIDEGVDRRDCDGAGHGPGHGHPGHGGVRRGEHEGRRPRD